MSTWTTSDGTEIEQARGTLVVRGGSPFARFVRSELVLLEEGVPRQVQVGAEPSGDVALDPKSAWLVDRWVRDLAHSRALSVESDYAATDEDAPPKAKRILGRRVAAFDADTIY